MALGMTGNHPDNGNWGSSGGTTYADLAQYAGQALGWSPDLILAQWTLETGHFTSNELAVDHNFAGIKYVAGSVPSYASKGQPASDGGYYAHFDTYADGVNGYVWFAQHNHRYDNVSSTKDPKQEAVLLQQDGWATDPNYANLLGQLIDSNFPAPIVGGGGVPSDWGVGSLFSPITNKASDLFQSIDTGMQFKDFDVTQPFGSLFKDGQALAIRIFLFLLGLIIIIFAFVNISNGSFSVPFMGSSGGKPSGAVDGAEVDKMLGESV